MNVDITIPAQSVTIPSQEVTVSIPTAQIVYQNSWLGQTEVIAPTTLFTPSAQGLYRASAGLNVVASSGTAYVVFRLWWDGLSDANTTSLYDFSAANGIAGDGSPAAFPFIGATGVPIQFETKLVDLSAGTLDHYNLYVTIEQLQ